MEEFEVRIVDQRFVAPFRITTLRVRGRIIQPSFHGYSIVQLTDLHRGYLTSLNLIRQAVTITANLSPDLVVLTGDLVQLHRRTNPIPLRARVSGSIVPLIHQRRKLRSVVTELAQLLSLLKPSDGFAAVLGNHDYLDGARTVKRYLGRDIRWLINDGMCVARGGSQFQIAGIDDLWYGKPDITKTLGSYIPVKGQTPLRLLLSHNPDISLEAPFPKGQEPHLILAGHTHGGQIRLPLLGPVITHSKSRVHAHGLSWCGGSAVYTSNGIGYGVLPLRLLCPPEIVMIKLESTADR